MPTVIDSLTPVEVRPRRSARIAVVAAVAVIALFTAGGIWLDPNTQGVRVNVSDHIGLIGVGVFLALLFLSALRPHVRVDESGIDTRGFFGGYRHVDWDLVNGIEFPPKARFARLVLPGDELIVLYAVQRGDKEHSVEVMDQLRAWHRHVTRR